VATTPATPHRPLTIEDYLALEESSTMKHEYVAGEVYALAGATDRHNRLASNILARLWMAARGGPCRVYGSDMKVRIGDDAFYYPDVQVVCDPADTEEQYKSRPCLVVEVLSPSTESIDRREKLMAYRRLDSLKAYIIVYRDRPRVVRHWRDEQGAWWNADLSGEGRVPFPCPQLELSMADIYEGLPPLNNSA
jgi:Uma2 family endonuclease